MSPELEELLKTLDRFFQADPAEAERLLILYKSHLDATSERTGISPNELDRAIRVKYPKWVRANSRTSTVPPKA